MKIIGAITALLIVVVLVQDPIKLGLFAILTVFGIMGAAAFLARWPEAYSSY